MRLFTHGCFTDCSAPGYMLRVEPGGQLQYQYICAFPACDTKPIGRGNVTLSLNQWYFVTLVVERGVSTRMYVGGLLTDTFGSEAACDLSTDQDAFIGANDEDGNEQFLGSIDDVRLYSRALSDIEIGSLYLVDQPTLAPTVSPPLVPSIVPSTSPSLLPTRAPSCCPSIQPSWSLMPSYLPSASPSVQLSDMYGIVLYAGTGSYAYDGNGVQATVASFKSPKCIWFDGEGVGYISDGVNNLIRKVSMDGIITTLTRTAAAGDTGNGGPASSAAISTPYQVHGDTANVYFAAFGNHRIKAINLVSGILFDIVGTGSPGSDGDGGLASSATINAPRSVWIDTNKNLFVGDSSSFKVRRVGAADNLI
eukprot:gene45818-57102_t